MSEDSGSFSGNSEGKGLGAEMSFRGQDSRRPLHLEQNGSGQSRGAEDREAAENGSHGTLQATTRTPDFSAGVMWSH